MIYFFRIFTVHICGCAYPVCVLGFLVFVRESMREGEKGHEKGERKQLGRREEREKKERERILKNKNIIIL